MKIYSGVSQSHDLIDQSHDLMTQSYDHHIVESHDLISLSPDLPAGPAASPSPQVCVLLH